MSDSLFTEVIRALINLGMLGPVVAGLFWMLARELRSLRISFDRMYNRLGAFMYASGAKPDSDTTLKVKG